MKGKQIVGKIASSLNKRGNSGNDSARAARRVYWFFSFVRSLFRRGWQEVVNFFFVYFVPIYYYDPFLDKRLNLRKELAKPRPEGISGFMRLRNEEDFVVESVESVIDCLDELVIIYNDCSDSTPLLVEQLRKKYPKKIRVFDYKPQVFPQGSKKFYELPVDSVHSLVNYYNFALAQTKYKYAVKIDGDDLFVKSQFKEITDRVRKEGLDCYLVFRSINLWDVDGKIFVNGSRALTHFDRGFFPVTPRTTHRKSYVMGFERFISNLKTERSNLIFFHLKGMKADRGLYFEKPKGLRQRIFYKRTVIGYYSNPKLLSWQEFVGRQPQFAYLPNPSTVVPLKPKVVAKRDLIEAKTNAPVESEVKENE